MRFLTPLAFLSLIAATPADAARPIRFGAEPAQTGAVVIPLRNAGDLASRGAGLDAGTRSAIERALESAEFDFEPKSTLVLRGIGSWTQLVIIGTGAEPLTVAKLQDIGGIAVRETMKANGPVAVLAGDLAPDIPGAASHIAAGASLGSYSFDRYKFVDPAKPKPTGRDAPLTIVTGNASAAQQAFARDGRALAEAVAFTRDLITEPANVVFPETFVERTRAAFQGVDNVTIEALDVPAMERLGMGSILSVGKGSARPPRMLIVHYRGASSAPVALVGKGITFDSGGISLKPGTGMWLMKGDMAGAAAVVGTALSLARSRAPVNVVAIAALAENMPGSAATRPGDVVKAMNGKTIEILNTDAEGRLVLADGVAYAERRFSPAAIVDIATLTGSVGAALGDEYAGLLTRHDQLADQLSAAGRASGEELWRLPLHPNYADDMKSEIADIKNVVEGGSPGAGFGGHFIGFFVERTPWAHLDIAGVDWRDSAQPTNPKGAVGYGVRLLDRFVRDFRPLAGAAGQRVAK
jgi:leucyl aminopeptidase